MQHNTTQDTLVGLFVASGIAGLFFLAMQVSNLGSFTLDEDNYTIEARFENSGGLKVKSPVSVAGVRIGRVSNIRFDTESYESVVTMSISSKYNTLPEDSTAAVYTAGLLGEQYVNIEPGGSPDFLENHGKIEITQSAIVLEEVIGRFLFKDEDGEK